jgi:hypothetical protein
MPSPEEPRKTSAISAQIFDLLKVGITLALTGLIGGGITYYYQERPTVLSRNRPTWQRPDNRH